MNVKITVNFNGVEKTVVGKIFQEEEHAFIVDYKHDGVEFRGRFPKDRVTVETRYVIVYQTDNNDLYTKQFNDREKVKRWLNKTTYKAKVIVLQGKVRVVDKT